MMLNEYGLQQYLAHEETRILNNMSSTPNEIRGTQWIFTPYLLYPYYHVLVKESLFLIATGFYNNKKESIILLKFSPKAFWSTV